MEGLELELPREEINKGAFWMKFLGWCSIICGGLYCLTIIGAIFGWLPIWLGIVLLKVAKNGRKLIESEDEQSLCEYLKEGNHFFQIFGISTLVIAILYAAIFLFYFFIFAVALIGGLASKELNKTFQQAGTYYEQPECEAK